MNFIAEFASRTFPIRYSPFDHRRHVDMLLGRTANGLYWMNRYIERAENMARLVDAGLRMALTRTPERL